MLRRSLLLLAPTLLALGILLAADTTAKPDKTAPCGRFSGWVVLTYTNPQTIIFHVARGRVNAATSFTMTASTTYTRNGAAATFADIRIGDQGTITATEQLPSGTLLACEVVVTGTGTGTGT